MANKVEGFKDAREREDMNSTTFYPATPIFGKSDIDEVPDEHRQMCVLVSWPIGGPERVFTESEVRAMLRDLIEDQARCDVHNGWQSGTIPDFAGIATKHGVSLDPA